MSLNKGNSDLQLDFMLIPAGEFAIGSLLASDPLAGEDEMPQHRLSVSDFHIMRYPVTNAQYRLFVHASGHRSPQHWTNGEFPPALADHPVVWVSFGDAAAFCLWAAQATGLPLRLPSEPEWEKAARGPDGRIFPWGSSWDASRCNNRDGGTDGTTPVGLYSPQGDSPYGVADMGGNVQEWIASLYAHYPYDPDDGRERYVQHLDSVPLLPRFHETGGTMLVHSLEAGLDKSMLRGGSWREGKSRSRCAYRSWAAPMHRSDDTGFRCCYE